MENVWKDLVLSPLKMEIDTKAIFIMGYLADTANLFGQMELFTKDNSKTIGLQVLVCIPGLMEVHMREKSRMV